MTKNEARRRLRERGLVPTAARVAVLRLLHSETLPLSMAEVQVRLADSDWHRTTISRTLVTLHDEGLAASVGQRGRLEYYGLPPQPEPRRPPHLCGCNAAVLDPAQAERAQVAAAQAARSRAATVCPVCHPG